MNTPRKQLSRETRERAARYAYRQRWLIERQMLPAPEPAPEKEEI